MTFLPASLTGSGPNVTRGAAQPTRAHSPDPLFHNPSDPGQFTSLAALRTDQVAELAGYLREHARALRVPEEQVARLHL